MNFKIMQKKKMISLFAYWRNRIKWDRLVYGYRFFKSFIAEDGKYTLMFVPDDGGTITSEHVDTRELREYYQRMRVYIRRISIGVACLFVTAVVLTMVNITQEAELADFHRTRKDQEERLRRVETASIHVQQELGKIHKLDKEVRAKMKEQGMKVQPVDEATIKARKDLAGQGGQWHVGVSKYDVMLTQLQNEWESIRVESNNMRKLMSNMDSEFYRLSITPSFWPTDSRDITSKFGSRENPFDGSSDVHPGIDIGAFYGEPVYAAADGEVLMAEQYGGYGNYVRLYHESGYVTAYGHMSKILVKSGQMVKRGQVIGHVGSTGYSTGPHLHFEIIDNGKQIDPFDMMN